MIWGIVMFSTTLVEEADIEKYCEEARLHLETKHVEEADTLFEKALDAAVVLYGESDARYWPPNTPEG